MGRLPFYPAAGMTLLFLTTEDRVVVRSLPQSSIYTTEKRKRTRSVALPGPAGILA